MANPNGGIAGGPATAAMRRQDNNSILGNFLHWAIYGKTPGSGLNALPTQLWQMFNPTTKAGAANLVSMFAGGGEFNPEKFNAAPKMGELGMPGQFGPYSTGRAAAGGHLSSDTIPAMLLHAIKTGQGKEVHDVLFGGEVHARGPIPKQPFQLPPASREALIQRLMKIRFNHPH